jgi:hypothetical protein
MDSGCNHLETLARDLYNQCSWRFDNRITFWSFNRWQQPLTIIAVAQFCDPGWSLRCNRTL